MVYPGIAATIATLSDYVEREGLELDLKDGVYVVAVTVDGPADRAGITAGDVILSIDGRELETARELIVEIQRLKVGDRITLRVARQGGEKREDVTVVLGELDTSGIDLSE
jgi:S1-C subfamily serine protease